MNATGGGYGAGYRPLAGAILCCTSIAPEQRTQLAHMGAEMGATIKLDLTSDVTHLIVGNTDSAKYRYVAKSRNDVKVLLPTWLEALREIWLQGTDDLDIAALEDEYRLPTFFGLKICLTGFDNPEQRKHVQETVDKNGAEYHGDLTKAVTHLIAAHPTGKKYEHALNWRLKIVSIEWFEQSLARGMVLDENLFNPTLPAEQRGKGAWDCRQITSPRLGKRTRDGEHSQALNLFRRKLRRSASTKMGSQSEALWAGITAASVGMQHDDEDDWTETSIAKQDDTRASTPNTHATDAAIPADGASIDAESADIHERPRHPTKLQTGSRQAKDGLFEGRIVCPHGFDEDKTRILHNYLESLGARVLHTHDVNNSSSDDLRHGFLVVPHDAQADLTDFSDRAGSLLNLVSNWWVERCLHTKRLVDPADSVLNRPFEKLSIAGFSGMIVNSTGFAGIDLLHVTKAVTLMGATYDELLSAKTSVMISSTSTPNVQKLKFATEKRIPAVTASWLWDCISHGTLQPFMAYQLNGTDLHAPQKLDPKPRASVDTSAEPIREQVRNVSRHRKDPSANGITKSLQPPKQRALELAPSANVTPEIADHSLTRIDDDTSVHVLDQEEQDVGGYDGHASLPLQDISANSPRRPSTESLNSKSVSRQRSSSAESLIRAAPAPPAKRIDKNSPLEATVLTSHLAAPADSEPPKPQLTAEKHEEKDYSDILAKLRANRKAAPYPAERADGKRPRRQLGRANSTRSNQSTAELSSGNMGLDDDDEDTVLIEEYQPSQELGWDSPGAAKAREQMIRRLGGTLKEKSVPVQGIGIVKDVGGDSMGRSTRRRG
ncbi:protein kinase activating protein dpb11 [Coniothyrium glycines]